MVVGIIENAEEESKNIFLRDKDKQMSKSNSLNSINEKSIDSATGQYDA